MLTRNSELNATRRHRTDSYPEIRFSAPRPTDPSKRGRGKPRPPPRARFPRARSGGNRSGSARASRARSPRPAIANSNVERRRGESRTLAVALNFRYVRGIPGDSSSYPAFWRVRRLSLAPVQVCPGSLASRRGRNTDSRRQTHCNTPRPRSTLPQLTPIRCNAALSRILNARRVGDIPPPDASKNGPSLCDSRSTRLLRC